MLTCRGFIGSFFISENSDRCGNQRKNFIYNSHARVAAFGDCARVRIFVPGTSDSGVRKSVRRHSGVFAAQNIKNENEKNDLQIVDSGLAFEGRFISLYFLKLMQSRI